ncbi:thermosome subunit [Candidatus Pacearchaeota archaeon]|nr:thermosome subunit [Candidatus Pacearchaeota archaeon]
MVEQQSILPEDAQRLLGRDAQRNNILAARIVAETVKTTLGPKGMDKMLVDSAGGITVTNDGVTILEEMDIEHPAAKMVVEVAKTQEEEVGDGTTTAVMLAGKLLENAEKLLDMKIHPTIIAKGYRFASERTMDILKGIAVEINSEEDLMKVAQTAMTGKGAEYMKEKFSKIIVDAAKVVSWEGVVDLDDVKIEKQKGQPVENTELIEGVVLDKERLSLEMPKKVDNAKIVLVDAALEIKNPETETRISISSPEQLKGFLAQEDETLKEMVGKIKESGANVVVCQKGIDEMVQFYLAKAGIYAIRRVAKSDMQKLAKATGGRIVSNLKELSGEDLGSSSVVEERKIGEEGMTYVLGCRNPKALTILVRGGTEHVVDEIERAIKDGLGDVAATLKDSKVVAGGGAVEIELSRKIRELAQQLKGRERLAVEEFALALEFIPTTLAENAGMDPIDILTELRGVHDAGNVNAGLNLFTGKIEDTLQQGILEPLKVKMQAISSASEVAIMILRIDDVVASKKAVGQGMGGAGAMGGFE